MIIITAPVHQYLINFFEEKKIPVIYDEQISSNELMELLPNATGLVVTTRLKITKEMIDVASKLKWIGRLGSGLELIDVDYATSKGIICISTPEGNRNAVAEHELGILLSLLNKIHHSANEVCQQNLWRRRENRGTELAGKVVGIVGFGNTGGAFARLLSGFDVTILAYDKYKSGFGGTQVREASLEHICMYADVISFHVPLTDETYYMANEYFFNSLKNKPVLLNTSRGPVVKTEALIHALKTGQVSAAGLDVLENEKLSELTMKQQEEFDWLKVQQNVIITPHIAGYSHEAYFKMSAFLVDKLNQLVFNKKL